MVFLTNQSLIVRDEWDNNKADLEKQLSEFLGETWTLEVNPNAIWPYHNEGYAKESLGSCIKAYVVTAPSPKPVASI
jgi:hypothetical protein